MKSFSTLLSVKFDQTIAVNLCNSCISQGRFNVFNKLKYFLRLTKVLNFQPIQGKSLAVLYDHHDNPGNHELSNDPGPRECLGIVKMSSRLIGCSCRSIFLKPRTKSFLWNNLNKFVGQQNPITFTPILVGVFLPKFSLWCPHYSSLPLMWQTNFLR